MSTSIAAQPIRPTRSIVHVPALIRVGSETIIVVGAQVVAGIAGVATVSWLSTTMEESQYGLYAFAVLLTTLAQPVFYGVGAALVRYYGAALDAGTLQALLDAVWETQRKRLGLLTAIFAVLIGFCMAAQCESLRLPIILLVFLCAAVTSSGNLCDQLHAAERRRLPVAIHQIASACLKFVLAGCLVATISASALGALFGLALAAFGTAALQSLSYQRRCRNLFHRAAMGSDAAGWSGPVQRFSTPFISWSVAVILQQAADRLALFWCCTDAEVGVFSAIAGISFMPAMLLFQCVGQVARPIVFRHAGAESDPAGRLNSARQSAKLTRFALTGALALTLLAAVFGQTVFDLLLDQKYASAAPLIPVMVLSGCLFGCSQIAELTLMVFSRVASASRIRCVFAAFALAAAIPAATACGIYGVAAASAIVQLLALLALLVTADKQVTRGCS